MSDFDFTALHSALEGIAHQGRSALLPALHAAQDIYGYLPEAVAAEIGRLLDVPLADIYGVIDFYSMFYRDAVGKTVIQVCDDPACGLAGSDELLARVCRHLGIAPHEISADGLFTVERAPCLGLCEHAPAVLVGNTAVGRARPDDVDGWLGGDGEVPHSLVYGSQRRLTVNCGKQRQTSLGEYLAGGGYSALKKALHMPAEAVIAEVKASGLVGRGGAAFPTGLKWEGASNAVGQPKYIVCNADESEPGTFKDRVLMEEDPQRIIEGLIIGGYAIGAGKGYIFVRAEYPAAYRAFEQALEEAREGGYIGGDILGSRYAFEVELRRGAGAYICGEETALFEAIEGKRGFPRVKPPFPTTHGLFGKPTVINNVETLCNVPYVILNGAAEYRRLGTAKSPGTKLFCVSGDVARPGVYEVPFGVTLRHLLEELAGGVPGGYALQAVLFGGAAGAFATPAQLDVRMTFEDLRLAGLPLGSGVVMVFDERRDLRDVLRRLARFFAHESCGKCYPCQLGTQRQHEILERISHGETLPGDGERLTDVGWTMSDASLCGLGQTAASAVLSAMQLWPALFEPIKENY
jgi:NADH-quinone oxidoreductase subunit F